MELSRTASAESGKPPGTLRPLVSVVIPVYNGERTIREAIESVQEQSFTNFELIVVDDGSKDATLEILSRITDPRIIVIPDAHSGVSACRNRGASISAGDLIAFLDADDLWHRDKLEVELAVLEENPEAAVVYSGWDTIDELGVVRKGQHHAESGNVYEKLLAKFFIGNCSSHLIRKAAFLEVGGFDKSLEHSQDWDLFIRLAAKYPFAAVPRPLVLYRQTSGSASSNVGRLEKGCLTTIRKALEQAPASLQHLKAKSMGNTYRYLFFKMQQALPFYFQDRKDTLTALRILWRHAKYNGFSVLLTRDAARTILGIILVLLLPADCARSTLSACSKAYRSIRKMFKRSTM